MMGGIHENSNEKLKLHSPPSIPSQEFAFGYEETPLSRILVLKKSVEESHTGK